MKKQYFLVAVSLLGSLFIYLFYRTDRTLVNAMAKAIFPEDQYFAIRESISSTLPLSSPIIYSLPEGLWVFCISLTSRSFFLKFRRLRLPCIFLPLLFSIGLEFFQLAGITKGRFDPVDIAVSVLFWMLAYFFFSHDGRKQDILASLNLRSSVCFFSYCIVYLAHVLD